MPQAISGELLSQGGEIVHIAASVPTVCENQELRPLTRTELEEILFPQSTVTIMRSLPLQKFEIHAPNGTSFTVAETLQAIVDIERTVRPQICWYIYTQTEGWELTSDALSLTRINAVSCTVINKSAYRMLCSFYLKISVL